MKKTSAKLKKTNICNIPWRQPPEARKLKKTSAKLKKTKPKLKKNKATLKKNKPKLKKSYVN